MPTPSFDHKRFAAAREQIYGRCWQVVRACQSAHQECAAMYGAGHSLPGIFMHHAIFIGTAAFFRDWEVREAAVPEWLAGHRQPTFPYLDHHDVVHGLDVGKKQFATTTKRVEKRPPLASRAKRAIVAAVSTVLGGARIGVTGADVDNATLSRVLMARGLGVIYITPPRKAFIPDAERQFAILKERLASAYAAVGLDDLAAIAIPAVEAHARHRITGEKPDRLKLDVLVTGSQANLGKRILAAQAVTENIPVLAVRHGWQDFVRDEPVETCSDIGYATYVLAQGSQGLADLKALETGFFLSEIAEVFPSTVDFINDIYDPARPIRRLSDAGPRWVYVPTSLSTMIGYGPWGHIPDALYVEWMRGLLAVFPDMKVKLHPKEQELGRLKDILSLPDDRVIGGNLTESLQDADVLVFDYVSTGNAIGAATDKPIIHFDLHTRKMTGAAMAALRQRCIYVDVDRHGLRGLKDCVASQADRTFTNTYTPQFSLGPGGGRESVLANALGTILAGRRT